MRSRAARTKIPDRVPLLRARRRRAGKSRFLQGKVFPEGDGLPFPPDPAGVGFEGPFDLPEPGRIPSLPGGSPASAEPRSNPSTGRRCRSRADEEPARRDPLPEHVPPFPGSPGRRRGTFRTPLPPGRPFRRKALQILAETPFQPFQHGPFLSRTSRRAPISA